MNAASLIPASRAALPAAYEAARTALAECSRIDECKTWADKAAALASYAKQADDKSLENHATRIRARAISRCGELLQQIEAAKGGDRGGGRPSKDGNQSAGRDPLVSRSSAARDLFELRLEAGLISESAWLVHEIVSAHDAIEGDDTDWYKCCAYDSVRSVVRKVVQEYRGESTTAVSQLVFDGFERLQRAYSIERDGCSLVIPIDQITYEELTAKIDALEAFAEGALVHARELRRYRDEHTRAVIG